MNKKVLGVPVVAVIVVIAFCIIGIIVGSFFDFQISQALANKTEIATWFANYGGYFSYCLCPAAGMLIFKGLKKQ